MIGRHRIERWIDRCVEFAMRPRVRTARRWSFVVTLPLAGVLFWLRGAQTAALLPVIYLLALGALVAVARRVGGPRGELLLDFVMHPVGRRAIKAEFHLFATLGRAARRGFTRKAAAPQGEFPYTRRSSDLAATLALAPAVVCELAIIELLLSGLPLLVRLALGAISLYGLIWLVGWSLGLRVYPHRIHDGMLEARLGTFYRALVPLEAIGAVHLGSRRPGKRTQLVVDDTAAAFAVGGRADLRLELRQPIAVDRPLGDPIEVFQLELAANDPTALANALEERHTAKKGSERDGHVRGQDLCGSHGAAATPAA